jgi:hypothetical protein
MTATQTSPLGFPQNVYAALRRIGLLLGKALLAVMIIFMAGFIAIATAMAGLALAGTALLMRLFGGERGTTTTYHETTDGQGITLEARKTPRGWTVE